MKKIFLLCLLSSTAAILYAQKQTYDLVSYIPPPGWKNEVKNNLTSYTITNSKKNSWCQIFIVKSTTSKGSIEADFESEWQEFAVKNYNPPGPPQSGEAQEADGWKIKTGIGKFVFNNNDAMVMVTTFSGYDRCVSIVSATNSEGYIKDIEALLSSVDLIKPKVHPVQQEATLPQTPNINNKPVTNSLVIGSWGKSNSVSQLYNNSRPYSYIQPTKYIKHQYFFNENGSYTFLGKHYDDDYVEILLIKESGTFTVNGDMLTVVPKTSVIEAWSKKGGGDNWGQLRSSQKKALEKVTYQVSIKDNHLLLSTSKETERDGRMSSGNFYSYGPPGTFTPIKLPGQ